MEVGKSRKEKLKLINDEEYTECTIVHTITYINMNCIEEMDPCIYNILTSIVA